MFDVEDYVCILKGVDIECISRPHGVSGEDCIKKAPANSIIRLSCKKYYVPVYSDSVEKKCDSSGQWLPREPFDCKLGVSPLLQRLLKVVFPNSNISNFDM